MLQDNGLAGHRGDAGMDLVGLPDRTARWVLRLVEVLIDVDNESASRALRPDPSAWSVTALGPAYPSDWKARNRCRRRPIRWQSASDSPLMKSCRIAQVS